MQAFQVAQDGHPARLTDIPRPRPAPGEVLLRIEACGVNFADLLMQEGRYQDTPPAPFTLGLEVAGVVEETGAGVSGIGAGDRVAVFAGAGGMAEYGCFPAARCLPLPAQMPFEEAAAFQVAYGTSHLALFHRAGLKPGERVLVLGAAGGVGLSAVELAAQAGAEVVAVARGPRRLEVARAAGATHLLDAETEDLAAALKALGGVDVVYDPVGGDQFRAALRACRPEARMIVIGFASGKVPQIPANILLVKNVSVIGLYWGGYLRFAPDILTGSLRALLERCEQGRLRPHVSHVLPLERAAEALELLRSRRATGKVVIRPRPEAPPR